MKWPDSGHVLKAVPTGLPEVRAEAERRMRRASGGGRLQAAWGSWGWVASAVALRPRCCRAVRWRPAPPQPGEVWGGDRGQRRALSLTRSPRPPRGPMPFCSSRPRDPGSPDSSTRAALRDSLSEPRSPCLSTGL